MLFKMASKTTCVVAGILFLQELSGYVILFSSHQNFSIKICLAGHYNTLESSILLIMLFTYAWKLPFCWHKVDVKLVEQQKCLAMKSKFVSKKLSLCIKYMGILKL